RMQPTTQVVGKLTNGRQTPMGRKKNTASRKHLRTRHLRLWNPGKRKRLPTFLLIAFIYAGNDLLSHTLSRASAKDAISGQRKHKPRSGERMQPTAGAVGKGKLETDRAPKGRKIRNGGNTEDINPRSTRPDPHALCRQLRACG